MYGKARISTRELGRPIAPVCRHERLDRAFGAGEAGRSEVGELEKQRVDRLHLLIAEKAPELWIELTSVIERDVEKLASSFAGGNGLQFGRDLTDKIIVSNTAKGTGFTAQWMPGEAIVKLTFLEQLLGMPGVPAKQDQMNFLVTPTGDVAMEWNGIGALDKISELLLRPLLP